MDLRHILTLVVANLCLLLVFAEDVTKERHQRQIRFKTNFAHGYGKRTSQGGLPSIPDFRNAYADNDSPGFPFDRQAYGYDSPKISGPALFRLWQLYRQNGLTLDDADSLKEADVNDLLEAGIENRIESGQTGLNWLEDDEAPLYR